MVDFNVNNKFISTINLLTICLECRIRLLRFHRVQNALRLLPLNAYKMTYFYREVKVIFKPKLEGHAA